MIAFVFLTAAAVLLTVGLQSRFPATWPHCRYFQGFLSLYPFHRGVEFAYRVSLLAICSRHPIYSIVNENYQDIFSSVACMDGFRCSYCRQISITLICKHILIGLESFYSGCHSWCPSMGSLLPIDINEIVKEYRTSNRCHAYDLLLDINPSMASARIFGAPVAATDTPLPYRLAACFWSRPG